MLCRDATFLRMYLCMRYPCHIYGRGMRIADECQVPTLPCTCMNENWRRERDNNSTQTQQYTTTTGLRPDCDCLVARASKPMYACGLCGGWVGGLWGVFVSILPDTSAAGIIEQFSVCRGNVKPGCAVWNVRCALCLCLSVHYGRPRFNLQNSHFAH